MDSIFQGCFSAQAKLSQVFVHDTQQNTSRTLDYDRSMPDIAMGWVGHGPRPATYMAACHSFVNILSALGPVNLTFGSWNLVVVSLNCVSISIIYTYSLASRIIILLFHFHISHRDHIALGNRWLCMQFKCKKQSTIYQFRIIPHPFQQDFPSLTTLSQLQILHRPSCKNCVVRYHHKHILLSGCEQEQNS